MDVAAEDGGVGAGKSGVAVVVAWNIVTAGTCYEEKSRQHSFDAEDANESKSRFLVVQ
jgi:hypothetical protein